MTIIYNNNALQGILREEPSLRYELYSLLDSMAKAYANFDEDNSAKLFLEYLRFYNTLRKAAILPCNKEIDSSNAPSSLPPLSSEAVKFLEVMRLFHLDTNTIEKTLVNRIKELKENDSNFFLLSYLERQLQLVKSTEFKGLLLAKEDPLVIVLNI